MKNFIDRFGDELEEMARAQEERSRHRRRTRLRVVAGGLAVATAVAIALVIHSATPEKAFAGFPVLERPITDASRIAIAAELRGNGANLRRARAFASPVGRGYAMPWRGGGLCLALPDGTGGYAQVCAGRRVVARQGLAAFGGARGRKTRQVPFAALLPRGATAPTVSLPNGQSRLLPIIAGVATGMVPLNARVTYAVGRHVVRIPIIQNPAASASGRTACPRQQQSEQRLAPRKAGRTSCR
jgi:hypothetical protein